MHPSNQIDQSTPASLPQVFALATDTIWGLACLARDQPAVSKIFKMKRRDQNKPLVVFAPSLETASQLIDIPTDLLPWLAQFWPGALTFISNALSSDFSHCHPNTDKLGVRIPNHKTPLEIMQHTGELLAATSFNLSGEPPVLLEREIQSAFPGETFQIFGKLPESTPPSTVCILLGEQINILRRGYLDSKALEQGLPQRFTITTQDNS